MNSIVSELYEIRYYRQGELYKCSVPAISPEEAIKKLIEQFPEIIEESILSVENKQINLRV